MGLVSTKAGGYSCSGSAMSSSLASGEADEGGVSSLGMLQAASRSEIWIVTMRTVLKNDGKCFLGLTIFHLFNQTEETE